MVLISLDITGWLTVALQAHNSDRDHATVSREQVAGEIVAMTPQLFAFIRTSRGYARPDVRNHNFST